jgi:hypothetical protein
MMARMTPLRTVDSIQDVRVSTASVWSDRVWKFDVTLPGTVHSDDALDWGFALADGSRFTDPRWAPWCEAAKLFLWTLRVDPPAGRRRARDSSLVHAFQQLRVLIRWMTGEGYRCFADLDRDATERFLAAVKARPGRKGRALSGATLAGYARLLNILYLQRDRLQDAPSEDLLVPGRLRLLTGRWRQRRGSLPSTPDDVAVPLVSAAIRFSAVPPTISSRCATWRRPLCGMQRRGSSINTQRICAFALPWPASSSRRDGCGVPCEPPLRRVLHRRRLSRRRTRIGDTRP